MNGKIDYLLWLLEPKKIIPLQILIQLKICSVELTRIIVMEVKNNDERRIYFIDI
jgi:hypothetical protein